MGRFLSFNRNQVLVLITLAFVLTLGVIYFFIYVPNNQEELESQRFRCLQNIETNIQAKIDNSVLLLNQLLTAYKKDSSYYDSNKINKFIKTYSTQNFRLQPITSADSSGKNQSIKENSVNDSTYNVDFGSQYINISFQKHGLRTGIKYTIKQFIDPLLRRDQFTQYMILKNNHIIYQTFPSGITTINKDSLELDKSIFLNRSIKSVQLSGMQYQFFPQQCSLTKSDTIIITGLIANKSYKYEKNKLPDQVVLFLFIVVIISVLTLPWIKLFQMGSQDTLTTLDGLLSYIVSVFLTSLLFIFFLEYNQSARPNKNASDYIVKNLAQEISHRFNSEIHEAYRLVSKSEALYKVPVLTQTKLTHDSVRYTLNRLIKTYKDSSIDINQLFALKGDGDESYYSSIKSSYPPPGNYANRTYYKNLRDDKSYYLNNESTKPYYLEQIVSWATGEFTSVISKPSSDASSRYAVLTFNFKCLQRPVLTTGYMYCIINDQGKVLYHTDPTKNLNENLFDEVSANKDLKASIIAHSSLYFTTRYAGKEYNAYIEPIPSLPYSIIVFEDTSFKNIVEVNAFYFALSMFISYFLILASVLLLIFLVSIKPKYYKKQYFDLSWLGPDSNLHNEYNIVGIGNLINLFIILFFTKTTDFFQILFILLISAFFVYLFQNVVYYIYYLRTNSYKNLRLKKNAIILLCCIIVFLHIVAIILGWSSISSPILFELVLVTCLFLIIPVYKRVTGITSFKNIPKWKFTKSFTLMMFTRLVIMGGLPIAVFYTYGYNYEVQLITRYRQTQFLSSINVQQSKTSKRPVNLYVDSVWIQQYAPDVSTPPLYSAEKDSSAELLFNQFTANKSDTISEITQFNHNNANAVWKYKSDKNVTTTYFQKPDQKYMLVKSAMLKYNLPALSNTNNWEKDALYWILFLMMLLIFWIILHYMLKKLFALNLPDNNGWEKIDELILTSNELNTLLFIIGSPGSGKLTHVLELIDNQKLQSVNGTTITFDTKNSDSNNCFVADMIHIPVNEGDAESNREWDKVKEAVHDTKYALIIVNHFEYDIKNPATNRLKLNFIEDLLQKNLSKVMILSTVHPVNFLDSLNQQELNKDAGARSPEHDLQRWHVLLGHFKIVIKKLERSDLVNFEKTLLKFENKSPSWQAEIINETRYTHFLKKFGNHLIKPLNEYYQNRTLQPKGDDLSFKLGISAHYFYMYIWQSLTKEEKFLLHDLAQDGLVNSYDDYNLTLLISKGLIVSKGGILKIFNYGFRNFILTAIGNSEVMEISKQINDNGNWSKFKIPFLIVIIAILVFLFASQQEAYSTIIKYLTAITVGVPAILKLLSYFNNSDSKTTT